MNCVNTIYNYNNKGIKMLISPKDAIQQGWITLPNYTSFQQWEAAQFVSPNAIDFTADRVFEIDATTPFILRTDSKIMRESQEVSPSLIPADPTAFKGWTLYGGVYDIVSNLYVKVPDGVACMLIVRSTLNRNGLFITSGLYDSGFEGNIGFALHNRGGETIIEKGARVGQIMFVESDSVGKYAGQYNTQDGQHWKDAIEDNK